MRIMAFLSSLLVILSFALPWFRFEGGGELTFIGILNNLFSNPYGYENAFWWLNPGSTAGLYTFIAFFAGVFLILVGVLFGFLGGRTGPGLGASGMFVFTIVSWHVYGPGFFGILAEGYIVALLSFVVAFITAGGKKL